MATVQHAAIGSQDLKKDRSYAQVGPDLTQANQPTPVVGDTSHGAVNGVNGILSNGVDQHHALQSGANDVAAAVGVEATQQPGAAAPPLDESWRTPAFYPSFGKLTERTAQYCYNDLKTLISDLAEKPVALAPPPPQVNGSASSVPAKDVDQVSIDKKNAILKFAGQQRDRFIKTLVLSDWARQAESITKVIDINVWQRKQISAHDAARDGIGWLKRNTQDAKMPSPNIEGALEVLGTGTASWVPTLGYIQPKPLKARELLRVLRNMNVILSVRLNLHEDLPPRMHDYTIANGRVTFTVEEEFEVDLSVADEDPSSPFYFIDIRLLFRPSADALDERLLAHMEGGINETLAANGLQGCYDFLHNFILTYKINVLRSQAFELQMGRWFDCVKIENLHRSLAIRYWTQRPGQKSWIEFGIGSGSPSAKTTKASTSTITVRWFRDGTHVGDAVFDFDWKHLDLESYLTAVIHQHVSWHLKALRSGMVILASNSTSLVGVVKLDGGEGEGDVLTLRLPSMPKPVQVYIDQVTGETKISPASSTSRTAEFSINRDPKIDVPRRLGQLLCDTVQNQIQKQAEMLRWRPITSLARQSNYKTLFGTEIWQRRAFACGSGWGADWALVDTINLSGAKWWAVQLQPSPDGRGSIITSTRAVTAEPFSDGTSRACLHRIEKLAVAEVSFTMLTHQLSQLQIPYHLEKQAPTPGQRDGGGTLERTQTAIYVPFQKLMPESAEAMWRPWHLRLTHDGMTDTGDDTGRRPATVQHEVRLTVGPKSMPQLRKHFVREHGREISINSSGGLSLRLRSTYGHPFVDRIRSSLRAVGRLEERLSIVDSFKMRCIEVNLSQLTFSYNAQPTLSAQLAFDEDDTSSAVLTLEPSESNPHRRIRTLLLNCLGPNDMQSFRYFIVTLLLTGPLLAEFDKIESTTTDKLSITVECHSAVSYTIAYTAAERTCAFTLRTRSKVNGPARMIRWHVETSGQPIDEAFSESHRQALKDVFREQGHGWIGVHNGAIADTEGVRKLVRRLDAVVRQSLMDDESAVETSAQPVAVNPPQHAKPPPPPQRKGTVIEID